MAARRRQQQQHKQPSPPPEPEIKEPEKPKIPPGLYRRIVIILPYHCPDHVQHIQQVQESLSCHRLGLEPISRSSLASRTLRPDEINDPYFDLITGFVIIDMDCRLYVLEGLGGGCIDKMAEELARTQANTDTLKYLMNSEVKFDERLYINFGPDLKRIKLRENLAKTLLNPDIYIKSKVSEELMDTLNKIMNIRRCDRLKFVRDFHLCPALENLNLLERKYGDALTDEDIYGLPPKRKVRMQELTQQMQNTTFENTINTTGKSPNESKSRMKSPKRTKTKLKAPLDMTNQQFEELMHKREEDGPKNFSQVNKEKIKEQSDVNGFNRPQEYIKMDKEDGEVFVYSGQKLNYTEQMKWKIAEQMVNDPKHFYAQSPEYLRLSWPIVDEEKEQAKEMEKFANTRLRYK
ncbi:unnamed protein product [Blepharisma stoltei]|uniref:Uncharacterized protein n=1 Tax=Blepharisma stoltei TaxID=1481888 RepID=A0AAU9IMY7_9CILI|nr:unnamed protein product [Blepharisma stoltei]